MLDKSVPEGVVMVEGGNEENIGEGAVKDDVISGEPVGKDTDNEGIIGEEIVREGLVIGRIVLEGSVEIETSNTVIIEAISTERGDTSI